jgi:CheY-like chemotaxis protein/HPt (histidine-containing phosphotransfer) domain-containing protein
MSTDTLLAGDALYLVKPVRQSELYDLLVAEVAGRGKKWTSPRSIPRVVSANESGHSLKGRILLAEDNLVNQEVAIAMLQKIGVSTKVASNGQEALSILAEGSFDLVLMDCQMPVMDGFETTEKIRAHEQATGASRIPIVALTANAIVGDRELCLERGMDDYLSKPFTSEQLYRVLAQWLPQQSAEKIKDEVPSSSVQIDKKVIEQLMVLREGLLQKVIYLFRTSSPELLVSMQSAISQNDSDLLYKTAHGLKNSAANLGVTALADACRELEARARTGDMSDAEARFKEIQSIYDGALIALSKYLDGGAAR